MEKYMVDIPVKINIWIRTECQKKQFEIIKKAKPSILFIQSDGGRNETEWDAIRKNRELIDNGIDWECTVYRLYESKNNGLYSMSKKTSELFMMHVTHSVKHTKGKELVLLVMHLVSAFMLRRYLIALRVEQ